MLFFNELLGYFILSSRFESIYLIQLSIDPSILHELTISIYVKYADDVVLASVQLCFSSTRCGYFLRHVRSSHFEDVEIYRRHSTRVIWFCHRFHSSDVYSSPILIAMPDFGLMRLEFNCETFEKKRHETLRIYLKDALQSIRKINIQKK